MTTSGIEDSQRKAAKIAGLAGLFSLVFITVGFTHFGFFEHFAVKDPAEAARYVLAHEMLFRLGFVADVLCSVSLLVLGAALYVVLKPVDQNLALLVFSSRLFHAITWLLPAASLSTALGLLKDAEYVRAFPADQLPSVARQYLSGGPYLCVGLLFWSLAVMFSSCLWLRSGYIPRALAAFGILTSAWLGVCAFGLFIVPEFLRKWVGGTWYDTPMALFEIALNFVLLFRGLRPSRMEPPGGLGG
ncbi:MAG TPA: DUF4386 domain-containing protein [Thermoanaerobaculia bacterium]|nr:DUF4386 domain-containing protein [Thermoanaerobaculia bacterium]